MAKYKTKEFVDNHRLAVAITEHRGALFDNLGFDRFMYGMFRLLGFVFGVLVTASLSIFDPLWAKAVVFLLVQAAIRRFINRAYDIMRDANVAGVRDELSATPNSIKRDLWEAYCGKPFGEAPKIEEVPHKLPDDEVTVIDGIREAADKIMLVKSLNSAAEIVRDSDASDVCRREAASEVVHGIAQLGVWYPDRVPEQDDSDYGYNPENVSLLIDDLLNELKIEYTELNREERAFQFAMGVGKLFPDESQETTEGVGKRFPDESQETTEGVGKRFPDESQETTEEDPVVEEVIEESDIDDGYDEEFQNYLEENDRLEKLMAIKQSRRRFRGGSR